MGLSIRSVYNYLVYFKSTGLVHLKRGNVSFVSEYIRDRFRESFTGLRPIRSLLSDSSIVDVEDIRVSVSEANPLWFMEKYSATRSREFLARVNVPDTNKLLPLDRKEVRREHNRYVNQWGLNYPADYDESIGGPHKYYSQRHSDQFLRFVSSPGRTDEVPVEYATSRTERTSVIRQAKKAGDYKTIHVVDKIIGEHEHIETHFDSGLDRSSVAYKELFKKFLAKGKYPSSSEMKRLLNGV